MHLYGDAASAISPSLPTPPQPVTEADRLATTAGLIGYTPGCGTPAWIRWELRLRHERIAGECTAFGRC